jgi:hypothetical protein
MKTTTRLFVVGLAMGWASVVEAGDQPGEVSLGVPVENIKVDSQGNVTHLTFGNGVDLAVNQLYPKDLAGRAVIGMRAMPFHVIRVGDPNDPNRLKTVVIPDAAITAPIELPANVGANIDVNSQSLDLSLESGAAVARCQSGTCPIGSYCVPCSSDVRSLGFPVLIETYDPNTSQSKIDVLMSEVSTGSK